MSTEPMANGLALLSGEELGRHAYCVELCGYTILLEQRSVPPVSALVPYLTDHGRRSTSLMRRPHRDTLGDKG